MIRHDVEGLWKENIELDWLDNQKQSLQMVTQKWSYRWTSKHTESIVEMTRKRALTKQWTMRKLMYKTG